MKAMDESEYRIVPGSYYDTPKELWGFRKALPKGTPLQMARAFIEAHGELLGLKGILGRLKPRAVLTSVGATHVILQQEYAGERVHRGFVTVHIGPSREAYLVKNRAVPLDLLGGEAPFEVTQRDAKSAALEFLDVTMDDAKIIGKPERRWYPLAHLLRPALRVRVQIRSPREDWIVYVDACDKTIIQHHDNLSHAGGRATGNTTGKATVFDPNPVITLGDYRKLLQGGAIVAPPAEAYRTVDLHDLDGTGFLDGRRVTTEPTSGRAERADLRFHFASDQLEFAEVMAYHWLDRAIAFVEGLGYTGKKALFEKPLEVDAHGIADDQSWYEPSTRTLTFGRGGVFDAEDGETILHEFGHALQDAICPDFGQSYQALAMGEGFGDYLAAGFFERRKRGLGRDYKVSVMTWDGLVYDDTKPPCVRRLDHDGTFDDFVHKPGRQHDNGRIWSRALWDVREAVGRRAADRIIVESHFQLDGFTSFDKGARAILDADRNLYAGRHVARIRRVFKERGIGPVG